MINQSNNIPLMSFWPQVYNKILDGEKLLEYRRVFPKNCKCAFMYISTPVKAISGIIYFDNILHLDNLIGQFDEQTETRINNYLDKYHYAGTIKAIQKINPITLEELRNGVPNFTVPQSYLYIDNYPALKDFIFKNLILDGDIITNNLEDILPDKLCK
ncbi:hypothetical protein HMPREF9383_0548 [Streptococcus sanguinis SK150]|uniref:ASCH domain-containing protein n=1 Tax=Streptococcus sanguinis SK150 TaxID=888811 RepID=F0IK96_STRSA|nr:hypothetical protein [Streptococcus sanguinis]EGD37517.1 hypothetical protein HMPREF9383_0548 [Streptococcus sanguinis SK150]